MGNKEMIKNFYESFFNKHNINAALDYVKEDYIQHNPGVAQGRIGLMNAFKEKFKSNPDFYLKIIKIIEEDDFIVVYVKNKDKNGNTKARVVDIYRIENGMLAEHWDILQQQIQFNFFK